MTTLPQSRNEDIVVQQSNDETLIYFFETNKAVCLNSTSAAVFNHCNGKTTFDELKSKYNFSDDLIYFTLDKLNESNLLKDYQASAHFAGFSRREVIRRIGFASMVALPVISSLIAPSAAHAGSTGVARGSSCQTTAPATRCETGFSCQATQNGGGNFCCTRANRQAPGYVISSNTSSNGCTSAQADCCTGAANFTLNQGSQTQGTCTCR